MPILKPSNMNRKKSKRLSPKHRKAISDGLKKYHADKKKKKIKSTKARVKRNFGKFLKSRKPKASDGIKSDWQNP